jgi:UDP-4-amino-4,6-dideoxy-N-acetyl-beta-L-altrosamine N-acetyltransferase
MDDFLKAGDYSMRPVREEDLPLLLAWRNSERVHSFMLTNHKITWEEHQAWFARIKKSDRPLNFVFEFAGKPLGYIGYAQVDWESGTCDPGTYLGETAPNPAGLLVCEFTIHYAFMKLNMQKVCARVLAKNARAAKIHEFLGYKQEGYLRRQFLKDGRREDAFLFGLLREEWLANRDDYITNSL